MRHARTPHPHPSSVPKSGLSAPKSVTRATIEQREIFIEELVIMQTPMGRIVQLARRPTGPVHPVGAQAPYLPGMLQLDNRPPGLGLGSTATRRLVERVVEKLAQASESNRPRNKPNAEARILRHIRDAKRNRAWGSLAQLERLLSDIQGTRAPLKVDINLTQQTALMHVIGSMSQDEMNGVLAEYQELEVKATDGSVAYVQAPRETIKVYEVKGLSGDYMVTVGADGAQCSCEDFKHRGHLRPCKHINGILGTPQTGLRAGAS